MLTWPTTCYAISLAREYEEFILGINYFLIFNHHYHDGLLVRNQTSPWTTVLMMFFYTSSDLGFISKEDIFVGSVLRDEKFDGPCGKDYNEHL